MASTWAASWGTSWGNSWGDTGTVVVVTTPPDVGAGAGGKKRKRKPESVAVHGRPMYLAEAFEMFSSLMVQSKSGKDGEKAKAEQEVRTILEEPAAKEYRGLVPRVAQSEPLNARYEEIALALGTSKRNAQLLRQLEVTIARLEREREDDEDVLSLLLM